MKLRKKIQRLADSLDKEKIGVSYYKRIPICDLNNDELYILCEWLISEHFKREDKELKKMERFGDEISDTLKKLKGE